MSEYIVAKYGGTSMAEPERVAGIVAQNPEQRLIVVSAPGTAPGYDEKMTDQLGRFYTAFTDGDDTTMQTIRDDVVDRFDSLYESLGTKTRESLRNWVSNRFERQAAHQAEAYFMTIGEHASALYFSELIGADFESSHWVRFSRKGELEHALFFGDRLAETERIVTPGFFGYDNLHNVHTLGRGGSDRTGALAAVSLGRQFGDENVVYENWTDRDGIFSANPAVVKTARLCPELTRDEVREGAHGGSEILQGDTIVDLNGSQIVTRVRNTLNPAAPGTLVLPTREVDPDQPVMALSSRALKEISINDLGMANRHGYVRAVVAAAEKHGLSLEHVPMAQDAITLTLHEKAEEDSVQAFMENARRNAVSSHAVIEQKDKGVVYMVGEALREPVTNARVLGRAGLLLSDNGFGLDAVVSHPRSPSIALLVDRDDRKAIEQLLHGEFIG